MFSLAVMRRLGAALGLALVLSAALPGAADAASIERTLPVGNEPFGVTIDPADGRIYVANSDHGSNNPGFLSVVDPASPPCTPQSCGVKTIALASPPTMSALDRGLGRLFVTTFNRTLTFVDIATQSVVNTVPNAGMLGVAVDEATHHVYAASQTSLSMVDGATGAVLHTASAGPGDSWWAVALDAGAHRVYVTNLDTSAPSLVILNSDDLTFVDEVPLPEVPRLALAVDTGRQLVYVGGYSSAGLLYVVDANLRQITRTVDLQAGGTFPFSATLVTSEDRLYLSHASSFGPNSIVVLDLATLQVVQRISLPWQPGQTALHANGRLYVAGFSANLLAAVLLTNSAPIVDSVSLTPSSPGTNDVLQSSVAAHDADGDLLSYSFEWLLNGAPIAGATGPSLDLSAAGHGDRGDTIMVRVTASDGQTTGAPATASVVVADTAPTASVAIDVTSPTTNQVVTATATASDADGNALTYTFTWKVNSVVRAVTSGPNTSSSFDLSVAGNGDRGQTVLVEVVASDGALQSPVASASAVVANSSPTVNVSLSDSTPRSNDVLVATAAAQDPDSDPLALTYTWRVNGVIKQSGASNTFDLGVKGNGDNGDVVGVTATASDGTASATASASATVTPGHRK
jgi:DNA-binding beta-propeller fold protein YncE